VLLLAGRKREKREGGRERRGNCGSDVQKKVK